MKRLILLLAPFALFAQDAPKVEEAKPAAEAPAPESITVEPNMRSSVEVGYRWTGRIHGNNDTYRSVVNLGEGPRLLNFDFSFSPSAKWIDELELSANSWGGDPYNTARIRATKSGAYRVNFDYRNIQYFNALPSFGNPGFEAGVLQSQRTFDTVRRYADVEVEILPGRRFVPFVGYSHNAGTGRGITPYVLSFNEYPVSTLFDDRTDLVRGGVRVEMSHAHVTLEQGGYRFSDNQSAFTADRNGGNRTTPFSGQTLFLQNAQQLYDINGEAMYSKVYATANPASWIDLHGQFLFVQPKIETRLDENARGLFAQNPPLQFFPTRTFLFQATAKQPHTRAGAGFELRPMRRVRIIESWVTDRLHTASTLDRLDFNYNHQQIEALVEVTDRITVRGGHRFVWGDSRSRAPRLADTPGQLEQGDLRRQTALMGVSYRAAQRVSVNLDAEIASGDSAFFRTSLLNYQRVRARARYQALNSLSFSYSGSFLNNDNPAARRPQFRLDDYDALSVENSLSFLWAPTEGKRLRLMGEYGRITWQSDILYLAPQTITPERSLYRENGHSATLLIDAGLPTARRWAPRFSAGGSLYRSAGSRPTHYYQPTARISAPISKHVEWNAEWRWWAMNEPYYQLENFRNHQLTFSVRLYQ
jgi:hypothetical protein